jgi:DNA repair exonuclease SbcCD ATPase subunit
MVIKNNTIDPKIDSMKSKKEQKEEAKKNKELEKQQKILQKEEAKKIKELEKQKKEKASKIKELEKQQKIIAKKEKEDKKIKEENNENENKLIMSKNIISFLNTKNQKKDFTPVYQIISQIPNNIINKIIHIADIHIRLLERHEEYNLVFKKFYQDLTIIKQNNPNTLVCLCGDLLEKKDILRPNTIVQTWNFLKSISDILPLIIIAGNHDIIETNNDKIDSISSILKDRPINNIHYLRDSGVYIYNNIIFGVTSIIDKYILNKNELDNIFIQNNSNINQLYDPTQIKTIGLYHGTLSESLTNLGHLLINNEENKHYLTLDEFGSYDYILLGDIHKFQYLNEKKTVAYCSSMISQNFTETDKYHGYLEWDILTGNSEYHILQNDYAHHKIDIDDLLEDKENIILSNELINNKLKDINSGLLEIRYSDSYWKINTSLLTKQINNQFPKINIKWRLINKTNGKNRILLNKMISKKLISNKEEVLSNDIEDNDQELSNYIDSDNKSLTLTDSYLYELIDLYMKEKYPTLNNELANGIKTKLNEIVKNNNISNREFANSDWKILLLAFDNMYGYGYNNVFDFTKYSINDIIGIFGQNGLGKSAIIDIITFMLFSRAARGNEKTIPKDVINVRCKSSHGILIIESNRKKYMIIKHCKRNYHEGKERFSVKPTVDLFELIPYNNLNIETKSKEIYELFGIKYYKKSLNEEDRRQTEIVISNIIGTYENFLITSVLLQGNTKTFKDMSSDDKKKFLYQILKINNLDNAAKDVESKYKELKKILNERKIKLESKIPIDILEKDIANIENDILPNLQNKLEKSENDLLDLNKSINDLINKQIPINSNLIINNDQEYQQNIKKIYDYKLEIDKLNNIINSLNTEINEYENKIENLSELKKSKEIIDEYENTKNKLAKLQNDRYDKLNKLTEKKQSYHLIKTNNLSIDIANKNKLLLQNDLNELYDKIDKSKVKITNHKKLLKELNLINDKESIYNNNTNHKEELKNKQLIMFEQLNDLILQKQQLNNNIGDIEYDDIDDKILNYKSKIKELEKYLQNKDNLELLQSFNDIENKYKSLVSSSIDYVYNTLDTLKESKYNKDNFNDNIDQIKDTLDIIFNKPTNKKHKLIDKYDIINKFNKEYQLKENEYNEFIILKDNLINHKNNFEEMKKIEIKINQQRSLIDSLDININLNEYDELQNQLKLELEYQNIINQSDAEQVILNDNIAKITNQIKDIDIDIDNIKLNINIKKLIDEIDNEILIIRDEISIFSKPDLVNNRYIRLQQEEKLKLEYQKLIVEIRNEIINKKERLTELINNIDKIKEQLDSYNLNKDNIKINQQINNELIELRKNIDIINKNNKILNNDIVQNKTLLLNHKTNLEINKSNMEELKQIETEKKLYEYLSTILGKNGIPIYLLNKRLDDFTKRINTILQPFINKHIELQITKDDGIEIILKTHDNYIFYSIGGMESLMLDITFKIIIGQLSIMPKCNMLFIDESISVFDKEHLDNIEDLFIFLKQYYSNVYLITHIQDVKHKVDKQLGVYSINGYTLLRNVDGLSSINIDDQINNIINIRTDINQIDYDSESENLNQKIKTEINIEDKSKTKPKSKVKKNITADILIV